MPKKIRITISKDDKYDVRELVEEISLDPKSAYDLCEIYGSDAISFESFLDFDTLSKEAQEKILEEFATAKSESDAALTEYQYEKFALMSEFLDEE